MIVLLIILVVAAIGGIAAYVILQFSGFGSSAPSPGSTPRLSGGYGSRSSEWSERIADASPGCLLAVLVTIGVWVTLWMILLVLGLRVLTA